MKECDDLPLTTSRLGTDTRRVEGSKGVFCLTGGNSDTIAQVSIGNISGAQVLPAAGNIYATPLRFKLSGRPILSAHLNVETAGFKPKRPEILDLGVS